MSKEKIEAAEAKVKELYRQLKLDEKKLLTDAGVGIDSFKDGNWRSLSVTVDQDEIIRAVGFVCHQATLQMSEVIKSRGIYNILFAIEQVDDDKIVDHTVRMRKAQEVREEMSKRFNSEQEKIMSEARGTKPTSDEVSKTH